MAGFAATVAAVEAHQWDVPSPCEGWSVFDVVDHVVAGERFTVGVLGGASLDDAVAALGPAVGALDFVSHCYRRPRHPPAWPYNLFAMVHGRSRDEVEAKVAEIADLLGPALRAQEVLYSTAMLKKTGLRIAA